MGNLCYSIGEADCRFLRLLARIFSARSDWRNILHKQGFNIRWSDFPQEELKTNVYCVREIYLIGIFSLPLLNDYGVGNQFAEVVHSKFCKDFLENELHLFCVQVQQSQSVLQITERGFNAPTHGIKPLDFRQRILFSIQIRYNGFTHGIRNWKADNSERQVIKCSWIVLSGCLRKLIKALGR